MMGEAIQKHYKINRTTTEFGQPENVKTVTAEEVDDEDDTLEINALRTYLGKEEIDIFAKTSISQNLEHTLGQQSPSDKTIPDYLTNYTSVFEKTASERMPEKRPWDHAIELKPEFSPKRGKVYPLNATEQQAQDEFLEENLKKGYIRPSKSPMASPFFFVAKKDSKKLRPCQDYRALNEGTIKNAYPLPRIGNLLDKLKGKRYFTKLDLRWGYNNVRIKQGDEWKAAFITSKGLFEPLVMFFGLCNSPATFQTMMNDIFILEIEEGWLLIYMDNILICSDSLADL
jgi:hypothetical protein